MECFHTLAKLWTHHRAIISKVEVGMFSQRVVVKSVVIKNIPFSNFKTSQDESSDEISQN